MVDHISQLHPALAPHVRTILQALQDTGKKLNFECKIVHSYRSPELQNQLYEKGRTKPGKIVTYARAEGSAHCVSLKGAPASCAVDFALLRDKRYLPDDHLAWALIGGIAASTAAEELVWGGFWFKPRDLGHIELKGWKKYANS